MIIELLKNLPPEMATLLLAVLPITEIRLAIPVAIKIYNMSVPVAVFWSLVGNLTTIALLLLIIGPVSKYLSARFEFMNRLFEWAFARTRKKFYNKHTKYGDIGLILFVAVPLPTTGCWTGVLAAWLFGIAPKKAFVLISIGVIISSIIITLITLGVLKIL